MSDQNKAILRQVYEIFSKGNLDALDKLVASNVVDHNPTTGQGPGLEGVKQFFMMYRTSFPDLTFTVEDMIAEGDKVVSRLVSRGTHKGAFMGVAPTGKVLTQEGFDMVRIAGGKVVERWGQFDSLGLMQQLGLVSAPGPATTR